MPNMPEPTDETPEKVVRVRLAMAHAFAQMLLHAFDALLHHGVNYRTLPQYSDRALLDKAERASLLRGQSYYIEWIKRMHSEITAAIRRKGMRDDKST